MVACALLPVGSAVGQQTFPTVKSGKYVVELRVPAAGLFAKEETDVEFSLKDSSKDDPVLGMAGVPNAKASASVTMPEMPGMPPAIPAIHNEGVPGDYGIVLFFPHGGQFQIDLTLTPPDDKPFKVTFKVDVNDESSGKARPQPYYAELIGVDRVQAEKEIDLGIVIRDTKTKQIVKDFDVSHEKRFHLIVVSKDLGWFVHDHPDQQSDGTWHIKFTFPAGGDYLIFADIAPKDMGSQVVSVPLKVSGGPPNWDTHLLVTPLGVKTGGIIATMAPMQTPIPVGHTTVLSFKLTENNGSPISDLEPYLGAHGHLMIIHQDGKTFVHSHPAEDEDAAKLLKQGEVRFNARFPRPGLYKAWAQFQRGGKVITAPFVFQVK